MTGKIAPQVRVQEQNGQLCLGKDYTGTLMTVQFGDELEYLIDVLKAYQYDYEQQRDAYNEF
jgi:hypothetical protein